MRAIYSTLRYQQSVYVRTNKPIMPFTALIILVGLVYAVAPVLPADSYAASATLLCFISAWIGLTYADVEDPVSEQLLVLKLGSLFSYQLACTLFLALVGLTASVLAVAMPLLFNVAYGFILYKEPVTAATVAYGLLLHFCAAFMGTSTGAFFHPRVYANRQIVLLLVFFMLIIGFVKIGLHRVLPFTVALTWLFPPISEISQTLSGEAYFRFGPVLSVCARCLLYGMVLSFLRIAIVVRKRFS